MNCCSVEFLDRFASPLAVRPKEASDSFHIIGDVMPLAASAHVVAYATTELGAFSPHILTWSANSLYSVQWHIN